MTALAGVYVSPDFQLESGNSVYAEGGADVKLPFDFTLSGRVGYQAIDRNPRFGAPDYWNWSLAVSRDVLGFTLSVGYQDTNISRRDCSGGLDVCQATALVSVSRKF